MENPKLYQSAYGYDEKRGAIIFYGYVPIWMYQVGTE